VLSAAGVASRWRILTRRWRRLALALLLPVFAVMWTGGVLSHWNGAREGQGGLASLFLLLAGLLVLLSARSRRGAAVLLCVALGGFAIEVVAARTGYPFGAYAYTDALRPRLFGVPLVMGLAWMVLTSLIAYALSRRQLEPNLFARVVGLAVVLFFTLLAFALFHARRSTSRLRARCHTVRAAASMRYMKVEQGKSF
jgi:uncharacterized membrane protein